MDVVSGPLGTGNRRETQINKFVIDLHVHGRNLCDHAHKIKWYVFRTPVWETLSA
jgi:hypothetical protein